MESSNPWSHSDEFVFFSFFATNMFDANSFLCLFISLQQPCLMSICSVPTQNISFFATDMLDVNSTWPNAYCSVEVWMWCSCMILLLWIFQHAAAFLARSSSCWCSWLVGCWILENLRTTFDVCIIFFAILNPWWMSEIVQRYLWSNNWKINTTDECGQMSDTEREREREREREMITKCQTIITFITKTSDKLPNYPLPSSALDGGWYRWEHKTSSAQNLGNPLYK